MTDVYVYDQLGLAGYDDLLTMTGAFDVRLVGL